ncbi:hypothetical protein HQ531_06110 [bacterium]|nr:hypothetical protein [bacterium]
MYNSLKSFIFVSLLLVIGFTIVNAQEIPSKITFQGKLSENGELVTGTKSMTFTIGEWVEEHGEVAVNSGIYSVILGSVLPIPLSQFSENNIATLHIAVEGIDLSPDIEIVSSPYAFKAEEAANALMLAGLEHDLFLGIESINNQSGDVDRNLSIIGGSNVSVESNDNAIIISAVPGPTGVTSISEGEGIILDPNPITSTGTIRSTLGTDISSAEIQDQTISSSDIANDQIVRSLNGIKDQVHLTEGENISIVENGQNIMISASGGGGGTVTQINTSGGLTGGPITTSGTISIENSGVTESRLANNSVTSAKIQDGTIQSSDIGFAFGDITAVNAGTGLSGGGTTGDVSLSSTLGTSISNTEIDDNAVNSSKIQDGTITTSDLNFTPVTSPHVGSLTVTGLLDCQNTVSAWQHVVAGEDMQAGGSIKAGSPATSAGDGDIIAENDLVAGDGDVIIGTSSDAGAIGMTGSNNNSLLTLAALSSNPNNGGLWLRENGSNRVYLYSDPDDGHGYLSLKDEDGNSSIWLNASDGSINGSIKNFVIDHPNNPNEVIVYASIEGPEAAAYTRGTIILSSGEAKVQFEEHFSLVINPDHMTIQLTPRSASSKGLAAVARSKNGFTIKELFDGEGNYEVDFLVQAVREGYEDYQVTRVKSNIDHKNPTSTIKTLSTN